MDAQFDAVRRRPHGVPPLTLDPMWKRLRRRSLAPGRPALYPDQIGLAFFTVVALASGIYVVARFLL
jgi:hypothetical protein